MTMITLMSAILVFAAQNSFQIALKNWKLAGKFNLAICFQSFESKSLENLWKQIAGKFLKAFWKQIVGHFLKANRWQYFEI